MDIRTKSCVVKITTGVVKFYDSRCNQLWWLLVAADGMRGGAWHPGHQVRDHLRSCWPRLDQKVCCRSSRGRCKPACEQLVSRQAAQGACSSRCAFPACYLPAYFSPFTCPVILASRTSRTSSVGGANCPHRHHAWHAHRPVCLLPIACNFRDAVFVAIAIKAASRTASTEMSKNYRRNATASAATAAVACMHA